MNMLEAMRETVAFMEEQLDPAAGEDIRPFDAPSLPDLDESLQPKHIRDMLKVMESGINPQDTKAGFSDGKMGRWLGWAQAAVVAMGCGTLDDMKAINKRWADKKEAPFAVFGQEAIDAAMENERTAQQFRDDLVASPSPPALDGAGRDAVIKECAKVAYERAHDNHKKANAYGANGDDASQLSCMTAAVEAMEIAVAISSIKETP